MFIKKKKNQRKISLNTKSSSTLYENNKCHTFKTNYSVQHKLKKIDYTFKFLNCLYNNYFT